MANREFSFEILKDYGILSEGGSWHKHLTLIRWGDDEPVYDVRKWNEDMTKMSKGASLTKEEALNLAELINKVIK